MLQKIQPVVSTVTAERLGSKGSLRHARRDNHKGAQIMSCDPGRNMRKKEGKNVKFFQIKDMQGCQKCCPGRDHQMVCIRLTTTRK